MPLRSRVQTVASSGSAPDHSPLRTGILAEVPRPAIKRELRVYQGLL